MSPYKNFAVLLIFLLFTSSSYALSSGSDLLGYCDNYSQSKASFGQGLCLGMVLGVTSISKKVCPPDNVSNKQLVLVVEKYLSNTPQELHYSTHSLIEYSLEKVWPCKK